MTRTAASMIMGSVSGNSADKVSTNVATDAYSTLDGMPSSQQICC